MLESFTPCRFTFDDEAAPTFDGFNTGETWNGWPVVAVTPEQLEPLLAYLATCGDYDDDDHRDVEARMLRNIAKREGYANLSGFTPSLI